MSIEVSDRLASCRGVDELLDRHARDRSENVAIRVGDLTVSYGELLRRVERLAAQLVAEGLAPGDRIALLCKNDLAFCELMMAASRTGVVLVPLNFRLALAEIEFILQDSGARILFAGTQFFGNARTVQSKIRTCKTVVEVTADGLYGGWAKSAGSHSVDVRSRDAILFQMYTSGTTGKPKGALISQKNVLALMDNGCRELGPFHETSRSLVCMPLFHVAGSAWLFFGLAAGCRNDLVVDIDPGGILDQIEQNEISCTLMVPTVIQMVTTEAESRGTTVSGLATLCFGASPMPAELLKRAKCVFPDTNFIHVYGMTETTCMFTSLDPAELRANRRLESCGKPFPDAEMKIVDPHGAEVPAGAVGEIICRTPQLMAGYWNRPDATDKAIRDGWYHTGDAGYLDEEGFLYIRDRIKDLVITGGENVYPAEVENAVLAHPAVADVAVIGVPDAKWGEIVLAAIVLREGQTVTDDDLRSTVGARLARFKVPKRIERVKALPRNGAGKVTKEALRARFARSDQTSPGPKLRTD